MSNELKTEIKNLQEAIKNLAKNKDQQSKVSLYEIFVRLRELFGYNVYGKLDSGNGYALSNRKEHHWIFFTLSHSRVLIKEDYNDGTTTFKQFCCLAENKYKNSSIGVSAYPLLTIEWAYGVNASKRISLSWSDYYSLERFFKEFQTFNENGLATKILRKEKLKKLYHQ